MQNQPSMNWQEFISEAQDSLKNLPPKGSGRRTRKKPKPKKVVAKKQEVLSKHQRLHKKIVKIVNPYFLDFKSEETFIYDATKYGPLSGLNFDFNLFKLSPVELDEFNSYVDNIKSELNIIRPPKEMEVSEEIYDAFYSLRPIERLPNSRVEYFEEVIRNWPTDANMTVSKLRQKYIADKGKPIGEKTIRKILKNKLNFSYLKTAVKTKRINTLNYQRMSFFFLRNMKRALTMGKIPIYIDETGILSKSNNFKCWRKKNQNIFLNVPAKKRVNFILAVTPYEVIYSKFYENSIDQSTFKKFIKELHKKIEGREESFFLCMDNVGFHKTKPMMELYWKLKLSVIFTSPYQSWFDSCEFAFRSLKNWLYKETYPSMKAVIKEVNKIIQSQMFINSLLPNYLETLENYLNFLEENSNLNLDPNRDLFFN